MSPQEKELPRALGRCLGVRKKEEQLIGEKKKTKAQREDGDKKK